MTVSGRTYRHPRPRGFADWAPSGASAELLGLVQGVLAEYAAQLPMTARQIFYRLVGAHGYAKTERAYKRLCELLGRARRAGLIPFADIRDDGTATTRPPGWAGPSSFWAAVRNTADDYRHDLSDGQPCYLEIWVEASGMVPQAARVAHDFGAAVFSAGGFNGLTDKYETAERLASESRPVVILHIGDYDPSGCAIIDALAEDVSAFAEGLGAARPEFRRVAATPEQIARYGLSTAPQKVTDNRGEYMPDTVQAEALPPDVLTAELRAAIEALTDTEALTAARALGDAERAQILGELREFGGAR